MSLITIQYWDHTGLILNEPFFKFLQFFNLPRILTPLASSTSSWGHPWEFSVFLLFRIFHFHRPFTYFIYVKTSMLILCGLSSILLLLLQIQYILRNPYCHWVLSRLSSSYFLDFFLTPLCSFFIRKYLLYSSTQASFSFVILFTLHALLFPRFINWHLFVSHFLFATDLACTYDVSARKKMGGGGNARTCYSLKLPSPTKLTPLGHFPPASQAGRLAGLVFYVLYMSFLLLQLYFDFWVGGARVTQVSSSPVRHNAVQSAGSESTVSNRIQTPVWVQRFSISGATNPKN